jgi:hypothetical protein
MTRNSSRLILVFIVLTRISLKCSGKDPLHLEKEIPLPGVEGRIDHFAADDTGLRLFVAGRWRCRRHFL